MHITPSLSDLAREVPRIYSGNYQLLDNEWRIIPNIDIPDNVKTLRNAEDIFKGLGNCKGEWGNCIFKVLPKFALNILSLPVSNADVERIFSKVNLNKTKVRNKLLPSTQAALIIASEAAKEQGGCVTFGPSAQMINYVKGNHTE